MSRNLVKTSVNLTQPTNYQFIASNSTAERIWKSFAYCLFFVVSLAGNCFIGAIVYKEKPIRKTINFSVANMAMSDLIHPIFVLPQMLTELHVDSWLVRGRLGQTLCKLVFLLEFVSAAVSVQTMVLILVDRFGAVVFPLRSPLFSSKLCYLFTLATLVFSTAVFFPSFFIADFVQRSGQKLVCWLMKLEITFWYYLFFSFSSL